MRTKYYFFTKKIAANSLSNFGFYMYICTCMYVSDELTLREKGLRSKGHLKPAQSFLKSEEKKIRMKGNPKI